MPTIKAVKEGGTIMKKKTLQKMLSVLVCAGMASLFDRLADQIPKANLKSQEKESSRDRH